MDAEEDGLRRADLLSQMSMLISEVVQDFGCNRSMASQIDLQPH
ncbi:hypothetical protein [Bradyrhizobium sp.]